MRYKKNIIISLFVLAFSITGMLFLFHSHASSPNVSLEAENGIINGSAASVTDSSVSGGKFIQFGGAGVSSGVNKARPFATNSPWNTAFTGNEVWTDSLLFRYGGDTSTLASAVTDITSNNISVSSTAGFPPYYWQSRFQYPIQIDNEEMLVTGGQGTTALTVARGYNNSIKTTHNSGSTINIVRHWAANQVACPVWWSSPNDPIWTFNMPNYIYAPFHRNRPAQTFKIKAPTNLASGTDSDKIMIVIDPTNGEYIETWETVVNPNTHTVTATAWAVDNAITGSGVGDNNNNAGVRASNYSWLGGLITGWDVSSGKIDHAIALSLGWILSNTSYISPATAPDNGGHSGPIAMGTRYGIPQSAPKPAGFSPVGSMVYDALKKYGAFVGDFAGSQYAIYYTDSNTLPETATNNTGSINPLGAFYGGAYPNTDAPGWDGQADMDKIVPLLRVVK